MDSRSWVICTKICIVFCRSVFRGSGLKLPRMSTFWAIGRGGGSANESSNRKREMIRKTNSGMARSAGMSSITELEQGRGASRAAGGSRDPAGQHVGARRSALSRLSRPLPSLPVSLSPFSLFPSPLFPCFPLPSLSLFHSPLSLCFPLPSLSLCFTLPSLSLFHSPLSPCSPLPSLPVYLSPPSFAILYSLIRSLVFSPLSLLPTSVSASLSPLCYPRPSSCFSFPLFLLSSHSLFYYSLLFSLSLSPPCLRNTSSRFSLLP